MPGSFEKEDLRIIKTKKNLTSSIWKILQSRSFAKITVNDICDEVLVSRATFYTHYKDKYHLIQHCLWKSGRNFLNSINSLSETEKENMIGNLFENNIKIIMNLAADCDSELFYIISDFLISFIDSLIQGNIDLYNFEGKNGHMRRRKITDKSKSYLYDFCIGGLLDVLVWQPKKYFPDDYKSAVIYIYKVIKSIIAPRVPEN
jgi:L-cysteine desulfidase